MVIFLLESRLPKFKNMKRPFIILLVLGLFTLSCSNSNNETETVSDAQNTSNNVYEKISRDFIAAMSQENSENLEGLFPMMDFSNFKYSSASNYITDVKNKFLEEAGLKGWDQIKAKGYLINNDMSGLDIIAEDAMGRQFIINGLGFMKNEDQVSFEIRDNDIFTLESFEKQGGLLDEVIWF